jgi:hypothetical protein
VRFARAATLLLLVVSLTISVAASELLLRWRSSSSISQRATGIKRHFNVYRPDPTLSHALRPSWSGRQGSFEFDVGVRINRRGLRGREVSAQPEAGTFRILVVGDSVAFGWGVEEEETFERVLERRLNEGARVEVINAGVPGYSADQYLLYLKTSGFALEPDLIVLTENGNDIEELGWKEFELDRDGLPERVQSLVRTINSRGKMRFENWGGLFHIPSLRFPGDAWLIANSHLYNWVRFALMRGWLALIGERARWLRAERAGTPPPFDAIDRLSAEEIGRGLAASDDFRVAYNRFLLAAIDAETEARHIPVRRLLVDGVSTAERSLCVPGRCLDTTDLALNEDPAMYLGTDRHWSAAGHAAVGEALAAMLLADASLSLAGR